MDKIFALILIVAVLFTIGQYIFIGLCIVIVIGVIITLFLKISPKANKSNPQCGVSTLVNSNRDIAYKSYESIRKNSEEQGAKIQSLIDHILTLKDTYLINIANKIQSFHIQYCGTHQGNTDDLFCFILIAANKYIETAKRDYIKREYKLVIQVIELLKESVSNEDIVSRISQCRENYLATDDAFNNTVKDNSYIEESKPYQIKEWDHLLSQQNQKSIDCVQLLNRNELGTQNEMASNENHINRHETFFGKDESGRENIEIAVTNLSQITSGLILPLLKVINMLETHAMIREKNQLNSNDEDVEVSETSEYFLQKESDKINININSVPYWEHTYIYSADYLQTATNLQRQFYDYFKERFLKGDYLDIEGNSNYVFVLMFDLADDYKIHKDYESLKQQLETLASKYPITAKYINSTISKVVAIVCQEDAVTKLHSYDKSRGQLCRWIASGESIVVHGIRLIRRNYYIGECFRLPENIVKENFYDTLRHKRIYIYGSVLNPSLEVSYSDNLKNPFCSYNDMSPAWRYEYLMWLSGEKKATDVSIEILLFYLYGCEIRMFIDPHANMSERKIILSDIIELYRSLNFKSSSNDVWILKHKICDFIGCAIMKYFGSNPYEFDIKDILRDNREYQDWYLANKIKDKKSLSPEDALDIAIGIYDLERLAPSQYISYVHKYFIDEFNGYVQPIEVNFEIHSSNRSICYYHNQTYFNSELINLHYKMDTISYGLWEVHNVISRCYWSVEAKFRRYNKIKERYNGKETIAAIQLLPTDIDLQESPKIQSLQILLENEFKSGNYIVKPIDWVLSLWEYERMDEKSIHKEYADSIIMGLHRLGYGIAPNYTVDNKRFNFGDICVIYRNKEHLSIKTTIEYDISALFIKLASIIAHADKVFDDDFTFVEQQLLSMGNIGGNYLHLMAVARWRFLSKKQPIDKYTQNIIAALTIEQRKSIGNTLILLSCINGSIYPKRIECLKKILPLLCIETENIHSQVHRLLIDRDGFAVVEKKSDASEFSIMGNAVSQQHDIQSNSINLKKLRIFEQQTKDAQELLSSIFEEVENTKSKESAIVSTNTWKDILELLLTQEKWERAKVDSMCKERGLMLGAILEHINDFSYEKVDDAVIEDDDEQIYVALEYKDQLIGK